MDCETWSIIIGIAGVIIGIAGVGIAVWQWRDAKRKGNLLTTFLIGLKAADLSQKSEHQVNDMLARLK
jgi:hypothetical protein